MTNKPGPVANAILGAPFSALPSLLPGLAVAMAVAVLAHFTAGVVGDWVLRAQGLEGKSPISSISVAVVLGLVLGNALGVPAQLKSGLDLAVKKVLRLGIILVGIKLSLVDVLQVGALGVPVVAALVLFALAAALFIARRAGVSPQLGALAAASTAICGITATLAVAPSIEADDKEVAYTVANVTLFGLVGMLFYPYLAHAIFTSSGSAGLFLGTAIHDTSQVMGAALSYQQMFGDERAMQVATVAKLTRNAMLVFVVPLLAWLHVRRVGHAGKKPSLVSLLPVFVLGFLAMSALRTGVDLTVTDAAAWKELVKLVGETIATFLLATALAAVGFTTKLSVFKGLGPKPFLVGFSAALTVSAAAAGLAWVLGPML